MSEQPLDQQQQLHAYFNRVQRPALIVGVIGLAACLLGAVTDLDVLLRAYLWGYTLWLSLALGCLALLLGHNMAGGSWGIVIRRPLTAGARTLPLLAVLFVPVVLGLPQLYAWARPETAAVDPIVQHRGAFQTPAFFIIRTVIYFAIWIGIAWLATRPVGEETGASDARHSQIVSGISLILFTLTATFAAVDWTMSIEPHWFSAVFGLLLITGEVLGGLALAYATLGLVHRRAAVPADLPRQFFRDLGHLLLTSVMAWAYILFTQYLIIWSGNLPEDIPWVVHRLSGGWVFIVLISFLLNFVIPFVLLISPGNKNRLDPLAAIAGIILVGRVLDAFWLVAPSYYQTGLQIHWQDLAVLVGLGGVWLALYVQDLKREPLWSGKALAVLAARAHEKSAEESGEHA